MPGLQHVHSTLRSQHTFHKTNSVAAHFASNVAHKVGTT